MTATARYELMWNKFLIELNRIPTLCFSSFLQKNHIHQHGMTQWMHDNGKHSVKYSFVSIRRTTGVEPFYTTIATVTMNLIVAAAIVLLSLYVAIGVSYRILQFVWLTRFPDVTTSICAEAGSVVPHW